MNKFLIQIILAFSLVNFCNANPQLKGLVLEGQFKIRTNESKLGQPAKYNVYDIKILFNTGIILKTNDWSLYTTQDKKKKKIHSGHFNYVYDEKGNLSIDLFRGAKTTLLTLKGDSFYKSSLEKGVIFLPNVYKDYRKSLPGGLPKHEKMGYIEYSKLSILRDIFQLKKQDDLVDIIYIFLKAVPPK